MAHLIHVSPKDQDVEYWKNELPAGSRMSWGAWGRGTVVNTVVRKSLAGYKFYSFTTKFDGDRYNLGMRGVSMTPEGIRVLKDDSPIRFGSYCDGRGFPYTYIKQGDVVKCNSDYHSDTDQLLMVVDGVYNGRVHKVLLLPVDNTDVLWSDCKVDEYMSHKPDASDEVKARSGIWIEKSLLHTDNPLIRLVKAHDPYKDRIGSAPDDLSILLRDIGTNEENNSQRNQLNRLFNEHLASQGE